MINSHLGRLRILGFLEGMSLLILLFIAMPVKYILHDESYVRTVGLIHGILFILFVINTMIVSREKGWKFTKTTWLVLLASFIPFGTFYIDYKILKRIEK